MRYLSLFSGYGGFELGIQQAYEDLQDLSDTTEHEHEAENPNNLQRGMESNTKARLGNPICIGFSEIDKYATQIYKKHFNHKEYGDIKSINPSELPDFDLLCGGFPCQAFSIAGKRAGFEDTRGTLIYDVFRIIKEKHPKLVLLENVKGLLSHDSGRTFKTIITSLAELGYAVEWQVLNAKNFGVPQNRERVFIVGHLGGFGGRQVFPIGEANIETATTKKLPEQISNCLRTNYSNGKSNEIYIRQLNKPNHSNDRVYGVDGISPALNTMQGGNRQPFIAVSGKETIKDKEVNSLRNRKTDGTY
jgi:DNA (cytosine-5)-methyltransferase 1